MKIVSVILNKKIIALGDKITVKYFPIVDDEEDKENPITKIITVTEFKIIDEDSIAIVGDDGENYFDENVILN